MLAHCYCGYSSLALQHGFAQQRTPVVVVIVVETQQTTHKNARKPHLSRSVAGRSGQDPWAGKKKKKNERGRQGCNRRPLPPTPHLLFGT